MSKKSNLTTNFYGSGPLFKAAARVEDFAHNIYFSHIFNQSVLAHQRLEDEYIEAFLDSDDVRMKNLLTEIKVVESAFEAVAVSMDTEELDGWPDTNND